MGMVDILVMWPRHCKQTFVHLPHKSLHMQFVSIGQAVTEEMRFVNVDNADPDDELAYPILVARVSWKFFFNI